jgi:hypothetical protein
MKTSLRPAIGSIVMAALTLMAAAAQGVQSTPDSSLIGRWEGLEDLSASPAYSPDWGVSTGQFTIDSLVVGQRAGWHTYADCSNSLVFSGMENDTAYVFWAEPPCANSGIAKARFLIAQRNRFTLGVVKEWWWAAWKDTAPPPDGRVEFVLSRSIPLRSDLLQRATLRDTVVVDRRMKVEVEAVLKGPSADGTYPPLHLDLSTLGRSEPVFFSHLGEGRYTAEKVLTLPDNGQYQLPVWLLPADAPPVLLYAVQLIVQPDEDLLLFDDGPAAGWNWRAEGETTLDSAAAVPVYQGEKALTVRGATDILGSSKVFFEGSAPGSTVGYDSLRLAVHPGEIPPQSLSVKFNYMNPLHILTLVDWTDKRWQVVSIPLWRLNLVPGQAMPSLRFTVRGGTFYLDDVRLVAHPLPPDTPPPDTTTVVQEAYTAALPARFSLDQNYPNPFNSGTVISFALPQSAKVELTLYNLAGQKVATLVQGTREAGVYTVRWDGKDDQGRERASGLYLYRLKTSTQEQSRKLLLLR